MLPFFFVHVLVAFSSFIGAISGQTFVDNSVLGRSGYAMKYWKIHRTLWRFEVYSNGYLGNINKDKPEEGASGDSQGKEKKPVDIVEVDTATKTLIVEAIWNGFDNTPNRLRMKDILRECWLKTGVDPLKIRKIKGKSVQNKGAETALKRCRRWMDRGLQGTIDISLAETATDKAKRDCWAELGKTVFGGAIRGAIRKFGPEKKLVHISVVREFQGDDIVYTFE